MGEVYRARDTRLGRNVALKILPEDVAHDAGRRQRFELEARAVAALSHPNIVAVYDVGDGYIVSELVDGEPLGGAKLPLRKTLDVAVQIASGLACAHDAGIVHRDLKPDNILVTGPASGYPGRVKILDFGLAKVSSAHPSQATATEALTVHTEPGVVMGTVGYMSPEQVRGAAVDHRSDIFSFGVILFELLAGRRAFQGDTAVEIMTAILKQDPPDLPETVPFTVRQIVTHCLEKEPANRFQSARDLGFALAQSGNPSGAAPIVERSPSPLRQGWLTAAGAALLMLGLAGGRWLWNAPASPEWHAMLLGGPEIAMVPRIAPDGHTLAFEAMVGNNTHVAVMRPETGNWAVLTHRNDLGSVAEISWSVDGSRIYYDRFNGAAGGVFSIPVVGGEEHLVLEEAFCPEVLPDGSMLVVRIESAGFQLFRFWPDTGRLRSFPIDVAPTGVATPKVRVFPDGREAAVIGSLTGAGQLRGRHLYIVDLESGAARRLNDRFVDEGAGALAVTRDGQSVLTVVPVGNLYRVVAIPRNGRSSVRTLLALTADVGSFDAGADGSLYIDQTERPFNIVRFPPAGGHPQTVAALRGDFNQTPAVVALPDGRIVSQQLVGGRSRLAVFEAGKEPVPLVNTEEQTSPPVALAGRGEVAFAIGPESQREIALASYANGRITRRFPFRKGPFFAIAATPDGKTLYCSAAGGIWSVPSTGGEPTRVRDGSGVAVDPGGNFLLVQTIESNKVRLFRVPLHTGAEQEIPLHGPVPLAAIQIGSAIAKDGRLLASLGNQDSWFNPPGLIDLATGSIRRIPTDQLGDYLSMDWSPDGRAVAAVLGLRSTIWKFQPEGQ